MAGCARSHRWELEPPLDAYVALFQTDLLDRDGPAAGQLSQLMPFVFHVHSAYDVEYILPQ